MGGSSGGGSSTQTQKLDPWLKEQIEGNLSDIRGLQFNPYGGQGIANLTPQMQNMLSQMGALGQQGQQLMGQGAGALQNLTGAQAQQVSADQVSPSGQMTPEQVAAQQVAAQQVSAGQADLSPFQNPYQQQVVDQTISDMNRARQMAIGQGEDAAIAAGAFGGSRHGIADAETNRAFADRTAAAVGQLNQQGFNTALGAAQNQQGMDLSAGLANQQAGLQAGLANQQAGLQAGLANQQAGMTAQGFNLGQNMQSQLANQQAGLQAGMANQQAGLDANRLQLLAGQGLMGAGQGMFGMGQQAAQFGQDRAQAQEDWRYLQHMLPQQFEMDRLNMQTAAIQGIPFMGSTMMQQPGGSRLGGAAGGALSGMGMAGMAGLNPWLGAGVGLLGGMFG